MRCPRRAHMIYQSIFADLGCMHRRGRLQLHCQAHCDTVTKPDQSLNLMLGWAGWVWAFSHYAPTAASVGWHSSRPCAMGSPSSSCLRPRSNRRYPNTTKTVRPALSHQPTPCSHHAHTMFTPCSHPCGILSSRGTKICWTCTGGYF